MQPYAIFFLLKFKSIKANKNTQTPILQYFKKITQVTRTKMQKYLDKAVMEEKTYGGTNSNWSL